MKKIIYVLVALTVLVACKAKEEKKEVIEKIVEVSEESSWRVLFDGSNYDNWRGYNSDKMPTEWTIEDGAMVFTPNSGGKNIITKEKFTNFELSLEWKISEAGNSGFFWGIYEDEKLKQPYQTGPEIQVLDNERHPDAKVNPNFHHAGALYDMVQPTSNVCNPAGEWNAILLKINHKTNEGSVTLNGTVIVEFPVNGEAWDAMVEKSKFKGWEGFGKYQTGHIGLQDHGDKVWFRNIKIKELK